MNQLLEVSAGTRNHPTGITISHAIAGHHNPARDRSPDA